MSFWLFGSHFLGVLSGLQWSVPGLSLPKTLEGGEDRYPFFETFSNLPGQWHSIYNTTVLLLHVPCDHLCAHTDIHKGWRYSCGGSRSILSIVQGLSLVPSISPKLNRRLIFLRKIESMKYEYEVWVWVWRTMYNSPRVLFPLPGKPPKGKRLVCSFLFFKFF